MKRREFLQISGGTLAGAAFASGFTTKWWGLDGDPIPNPGTDGTIVPSFCELCFWKCGIHAHVKDGKVTKIVGNPDHPLSRGKLCPRGTGGIGLLYDPDRLKKPLLRKEVGGKQRFEEVSWDEALDFIADKMKTIKKKYGPESLALFSHGFGGSWMKKVVKAYGSQNIGAPSWAQCKGPRDVGFELTFGDFLGSPEPIDMRNAKCITLIGAHLGENMHNTQVQDFAEAIGNGADIIVVDPRFSTAAGKAKHWLPIKPGTDIALLLAWMHVLIKEGLYDQEYIKKYATGLDKLKKYLEDKTPEWAFTQTGIEPEKIVASARTLAAARPRSIVHPGRHVTWYGNDTQRSRAIAMLNALLGSWGRIGGYYFKDKIKLAPFPGSMYKFPKSTKPIADRKKGAIYPFGGESLAHGFRDATFPGYADYDIKAWIVYGTNLMQCLPDPEKTKEAIKHLDLLVAIDVLPAEITGYADVVLPECTYLERHDDLWSAAYTEPFVAMRQPAVKPMYDSKPGWWIAKELAKRLGYEGLFPWKDPEEYLRGRAEASHLSWKELKSKGVIAKKKREAQTIDEGLEPSFDTPTGKIELFSKQLQESGLDPIPVHRPPDEPPPGYFRLLYGRYPVHTFGRTTNNRFLSEIFPENEVWLNARMAKELGLQSGDRVMVENQDGRKSGPIRVKVTQRIRPDCVYMVHGFGHKDKRLRFARGRGASDSDLISKSAIDPIIGSTGMNVNFVRLEVAS
ncbi:MAG TPA: nitrate reductase [Planctomycetes bacterium]|nr:nitrate reductase [Planctomycetota bacterium]